MFIQRDCLDRLIASEAKNQMYELIKKAGDDILYGRDPWADDSYEARRVALKTLSHLLGKVGESLSGKEVKT